MFNGAERAKWKLLVLLLVCAIFCILPVSWSASKVTVRGGHRFDQIIAMVVLDSDQRETVTGNTSSLMHHRKAAVTVENTSTSIQPLTDNTTEPVAGTTNGAIQRRVFYCGFSNLFDSLHYNHADLLFPEFAPAVRYSKTINATADDIMIRSMGGPCDYQPHQLPTMFPGKILTMNGESRSDIVADGRQTFSLGAYADTNATLSVSFGAMYLGNLPPDVQQRIFDPKRRRRNTKKKFLMYITSNCVSFRELAFGKLAQIATVHYCGQCRGGRVGFNSTNVLRGEECNTSEGWTSNADIFANYRFGLVMENINRPGYITEKIFNAFLSGTVPIWYGTPDIFRIFNRDAFIYFDVHDPQNALDRVSYLEHNATAYDEMLDQPILANGNVTVEEYFSFSDEVGGGKLRKRIRKLMGL